MSETHQVDVPTIASRLDALYRRRSKLDSADRGPPKPTSFDDLDIETALRPRIERALEEPKAAINYMVWLIGETAHACGGMDLLRKIESAFYEGHGEREFQLRAAFLNARWDGVGDWHA